MENSYVFHLKGLRIMAISFESISVSICYSILAIILFINVFRKLIVRTAEYPFISARLLKVAGERAILQKTRRIFMVIAMSGDLVTWGEAAMIRHFQPAWNRVIDGFGIHDPGGGRAQQRRSVWDCLHPGRTFTKKLPNADEVLEADLKKKISESCKRFLKK